METISAANAKQKFGELIDTAQRGPVAIQKHGRDVAVVMSAQEYDQIQKLKRKALASGLEQALADVDAGRLVAGDSVIGALRSRIREHDKG